MQSHGDFCTGTITKEKFDLSYVKKDRKNIRRGFRRGECGEYSPPQLENGGEFSERWGVFFGKIRHNKQKLSINLTLFPFIFDQMFTNSSF